MTLVSIDVSKLGTSLLEFNYIIAKNSLPDILNSYHHLDFKSTMNNISVKGTKF